MGVDYCLMWYYSGEKTDIILSDFLVFKERDGNIRGSHGHEQGREEKRY